MSRGGQEAELETHAQALTTVDVDRVLGFEADTLSDWAIIQNASGTLAVSSTASQGLRALAITGHGYVPVQSVALGSLGSRVGSVIKYDIRLPPELAQISPSWYGLTQLYIEIPSLGLNTTFVGQAELTGKPLGQWVSVSITPSADILNKLRGSYSDLRVTIAVNAPYNNTKAYLIDNLHFSDKTLGVVTVLDGAGQAIPGLTVTAYNSATPTSNTGVTDSTGVAKVWLPAGSYRFGVTDAGFTVYSSPSNQCQVPGVCPAATIIVKCHGVPCNAQNSCQEVGVCDPGTGTCSYPAKAAGTVCRGIDGPCDIEEKCDGSGAACPADGFLQASLVCRPSAGTCDAAEICSGGSSACPTDVKSADNTACDDGNPCTTGDKCQQGTCVGTGQPVIPPAANVSINVSASLDTSTGTVTDGQQTFGGPTQFTLPPTIPVIEGRSGTGTATLTLHSATTCLDVVCTYRGASSVSQATTLEDLVLGKVYVLQACSDGSLPNAMLSVTSIGLHVVSGDTGTPMVAIQIARSYPEDQGIIVSPPGDAGPPVPLSQLGDGTELPPPADDPSYQPYVPEDLPSPEPTQCSPVIDGVFTPEPDTDVLPQSPFGN